VSTCDVCRTTSLHVTHDPRQHRLSAAPIGHRHQAGTRASARDRTVHMRWSRTTKCASKWSATRPECGACIASQVSAVPGVRIRAERRLAGAGQTSLVDGVRRQVPTAAAIGGGKARRSSIHVAYSPAPWAPPAADAGTPPRSACALSSKPSLPSLGPNHTRFHSIPCGRRGFHVGLHVASPNPSKSRPLRHPKRAARDLATIWRGGRRRRERARRRHARIAGAQRCS